MISVPADIAGQSKHAADWLDGRNDQGPSPVLARAKRQMEELEVDWANAFAVSETESGTVPRPKEKRTEEPAASSHLPPAISASHTAKPPHPPGKVLAQKTADQQLLAQAAQRVQRQAEQAKKKEDEAKKKKKEEEEKRKKKEKEEEEKRKKKEKEEEERRKKKEKEEEEKRRKKAEEEKAEKVMQRALSLSLHVLCISSRVLCSVLRVLCPQRRRSPKETHQPSHQPPHKKTRDLPKLQHKQKHQQHLHKKKRHQPQQQQQHKKTTHQPHHKKKRHQRPRHKKEKERPRKKKRHQKEQPQKATQAHKKKGMQPQLPLGQKTTDPNGRRSGRPKWWSKPLRRSLNDSARYTWYSARRKAHSARCKYVARATLSVPVRTSTVAHFSDLSDSVFACVLGWMSNWECF